MPRQELSQELARTELAEQFGLDHFGVLDLFAQGQARGSIRAVRMTSDHIFLSSRGKRIPSLSSKLGHVWQSGTFPEETLDATKLERLTVPIKFDGRVREIVVGEEDGRKNDGQASSELPSSTPCPPKRGVSAFPIFCSPSQTSTLTQPSSQSTASVRATLTQERNVGRSAADGVGHQILLFGRRVYGPIDVLLGGRVSQGEGGKPIRECPC